MKEDRDVTKQSTVERLPIESPLRVQEDKVLLLDFKFLSKQRTDKGGKGGGERN